MHDVTVYTLLPVFTASVIGSAHCAGMCGGFVAIYSHGATRHKGAHLLYSIGRLVTYETLGILCSLVGASVDQASGIGRFSSYLVGTALVAFGIIQFFGLSFNLLNDLPVTFSRYLSKLVKPIFESNSRIKPFLIGFSTTLLPCGWLYGFLGIALASGEPKDAALIMFVFWAGTLPVMVCLGVFSRIFTGKLASLVPRITGILLVLSGVLSFTLHLEHADHTHHMHHQD